MAKNIYIGNDQSIAKKVSRIYVGVNGVAKKVSRIYVGNQSGKAALTYSAAQTIYLPPGFYGMNYVDY